MTIKQPIRCIAAAVAAITSTALPARAADVLTTHRLSAELATAIATGAVAACSKLTYAVTATVVDADGVDHVVLRGDGAGIHTLQAAHDKAFTTVTYGGAGSATMKVYVDSPPSGVILKEPHLLPGDGGLPIRIGNEVVGGLGISGSPGKDEVCGNAALDQILTRLKP